MRLGFVGTGTMGNPMARCLIDAGHQLTVHDLRRDATTNLCDLGARWADSPRATAEARDVVFTSLPGPPEMEHAVLDPSTGILAGLTSAGTRPAGDKPPPYMRGYVDMTTHAPDGPRPGVWNLRQPRRAHGQDRRAEPARLLPALGRMHGIVAEPLTRRPSSEKK